MRTAEFLSHFQTRATASPVDVHALGEDRLKVLWALGLLKEDGTGGYYKPSDVVAALRDVSGIEMSWQRVLAILEQEHRARHVTKKLVGQTYHFKIMRSGEDAVDVSRVAARFVDPANALDEIRALEGILSGFKGTLRVCDTYIDNKTLDFLAEAKAATAIRLLATNVQDSAKLRRDFTAFKAQHPMELEIKVLANGAMHDRYIVHDGGLLVLGGGLKDFAKKQMFVIGLGTDLASSAAKAFDANWSRAATF